MGNCSLRSVSDGQNPSSIRVLADCGEEALEFNCPKRAGGSGIYGHSCRSSPLSGAGGTNPSIIVRDCEVNLQPKIQVSPQRRNGVWKAKVVIGTKQLEEILSEEGNTEALIEQLRIAAAAAAIIGEVSQRQLPRKNGVSYIC